MIQWSLDNDAEVKCFQEFYNKSSSDVFNVHKKMTDAGWTHVYQKNRFVDSKSGEFGQAIFSKHPILNKGDVNDASGKFLNSIWADLLIGTDTVRVYNVHLESMSIDENDIVDTEKLKNSYLSTGYKLRSGFKTRSSQVQGLVNDIAHCKYPMIICGDLYDLPFSYPYTLLRRNLSNAFESSGSGFGFSYNGRLFFLRIDNQFFSDHFTIHNFKTHRKVKHSDHFPLTATYSLINPN